MSYLHLLVFCCLILRLLIFSPDFACQIPIASTMQIGNTFFYHTGRFRTIEDISCLFKWHSEHLTYAENDSGTLGTSQYLFAFFTHSCSLPINFKHACNILFVRMQYCMLGFSNLSSPRASSWEISPVKYLSSVMMTLSLAMPPITKS